VAYNQMKKDYLEACKQPLPGNDVVNRPPEDIEQPPVPLRLTVGDITSQQLVRHCALRPEGTLCYLDEMVSWVNKITDQIILCFAYSGLFSRSISLNTVNIGFVAGLFLHDGSPMVIHHSTGGTSNPSTMCNLRLRIRIC
jgi:hypothetical protein